MKRFLELKWIVAVMSLSIMFFSCTNDNEEELFPTVDNPDDPEISFATQVQPIIENNCAVTGCHVAGAQSPNFSVAATIIDRADRVRARTIAETMPPSSRPDLTQEQIGIIVSWVDQGALNN